jgi:hypothetical protein
LSQLNSHRKVETDQQGLQLRPDIPDATPDLPEVASKRSGATRWTSEKSQAHVGSEGVKMMESTSAAIHTDKAILDLPDPLDIQPAIISEIERQ